MCSKFFCASIANYSGHALAKRKRFFRNVTLKITSNFTKKCRERFLILRKGWLKKITDGTFAGAGCHYNDCYLYTAVKKKTR